MLGRCRWRRQAFHRIAGALAAPFAAKRLNISANGAGRAPQVVSLTRHYERD
jgi:hypothetical protein